MSIDYSYRFIREPNFIGVDVVRKSGKGKRAKTEVIELRGAEADDFMLKQRRCETEEESFGLSEQLYADAYANGQPTIKKE